MKKVAIFVEGHTELIFIREYLLKMYDYQNIWVECFSLFTNGGLNETEYSVVNENATFLFEIINVGNDNAVLTRLLKREKHLWNRGFHQIFAIRDMYSRKYREKVQNAQINAEITRRFIDETQTELNLKAQNPKNIHFCFAIMEVEAWILGLKNCFIHLHQNLSTPFIEEKLGYNLDTIDPETEFFHPASAIQNIYALVEMSYSKSKGDINAIMSYLQKQDFIKLSESGKCQSFNSMHATFFPN